MIHEFRRIVVEAGVSAAMNLRSCASGADGISDIDGQTERSIWAGAHESMRAASEFQYPPRTGRARLPGAPPR